MTKQISEEIIEAIRHRADIVEIIGEQVALKKKGQNYTGLCPFHQEKTPSFVVSPGKQIFHCFGCGKGGNVYSFLMEREALTFFDAVEKLATRYGVLLPERAISPAQQKQDAKNKRYREINEKAMQFFQTALASKEGSAGLEYLLARGLDEAVIQDFKLGYAPHQWDSLYAFLHKEGVSDEEMLLLGLVQKSQKGNLIDKFRHRVMFPILNDRGIPVGFGGRAFDDVQPKYLNTQDTPLFQKGHHLYGMHLAKGTIRQSDQVILMEGYMDVIAAHQQGIRQAVASLGTALTQEQVKVINRYTYNTIISYDADTAGQAATLRGLEILSEKGCQVRIIRIPDGKDPDDFLRNNGAGAFLQLIDKAFSLYEYKFANNMEKFDKDTMSGKVAIIQAMLPDLGKVKSPVERQAYITMMAQVLAFPERAIKEELQRYHRGSPSEPTSLSRRPAVLEQGYEKAQSAIFRLILQDKTRISDFEAAGGAKLFEYHQAKALYLALQSLNEAGHKDLEAEDLVALTEDQDQRQWLTGILIEDEIPGETDRVFQDSLMTLRRHYVDRQVKSLMDELAQLEKAGDASGACAIMQKISGLNKEKQTLKP